MKILVPIDGSSYSDNSIAFVASRASLLGSNPQIDLLVVLDAIPSLSPLPEGQTIDQYYANEAEEIFAPVREKLQAAGIHANELHGAGNPAAVIAAEAERLGSDLIIMGSRGRTALAGLFFGSVTNGVLARTKLPILILRNKPAPQADAMKVGICVDGSKFGVTAVKYAIANRRLLGEGFQAVLINVASDYAGAVMPDMAGMALPALSESEVVELQKKEFDEAVEPLRPLFEKAAIKPREVCLVGNPGDEIAAYARKKKLDILVMGSHGYGRFKSAVMGSTAMRIAAQGDVPILLIRR